MWLGVFLATFSGPKPARGPRANGAHGSLQVSARLASMEAAAIAELSFSRLAANIPVRPFICACSLGLLNASNPIVFRVFCWCWLNLNHVN